jgi:hypothetical protein
MGAPFKTNQEKHKTATKRIHYCSVAFYSTQHDACRAPKAPPQIAGLMPSVAVPLEDSLAASCQAIRQLLHARNVSVNLLEINERANKKANKIIRKNR